MLAAAKKIGPELLPTPGVGGKISSMFMKLGDQGKYGMSFLTDADPK